MTGYQMRREHYSNKKGGNGVGTEHLSRLTEDQFGPKDRLQGERQRPVTSLDRHTV